MRTIILRDFFPKEKAEELSKNIYNMNPTWRRYAYKMGERTEYHIENQKDSKYLKEHLEADLHKSLDSGLYSYKFRRSVPHVKNCSCFLCEFYADYLNTEFIDTLVKETLLEKPSLFEAFISCYSVGDFLNMHKDQKRGVAFIFNLTPTWRPEYGGLLSIEKENGLFNTIFPEFNSLILIELNNIGKNHFVSQVSSFAPHSRIAISGWFND